MIAKAGKPGARLVPMEWVKVARRYGALNGPMRLGDDCDAPLPDAVLAVDEVPCARLLIAQAVAEPLLLITSDTQLPAYGDPVRMAWGKLVAPQATACWRSSCHPA